MKLRYFLLLLPAMLLLTACAAAETPAGQGSDPAQTPTVSAPETAGNAGFTDEKKRYRLQIPEGWKESITEKTETETVLRAPDGTQTLTISCTDADVNLLAYTKSELAKSYAKQLENFQLQQFSSLQSQGNTGIYLRYTCTQNGQTVYAQQAIFAGDADYSLTYASLQDDADFRAAVQESFRSFAELEPGKGALWGRLQGQQYRAADGSYALEIPQNWRYRKTAGTAVQFQKQDGSANLTIRQEELDSRLFRYKKSYFAEALTQTFGSSAKLQVFSTVQIGAYRAKYLECAYTYGGKALQARQYLLNTKQHTYVLTMTTAANAKNKPELTAVAESFAEIS